MLEPNWYKKQSDYTSKLKIYVIYYNFWKPSLLKQKHQYLQNIAALIVIAR